MSQDDRSTRSGMTLRSIPRVDYLDSAKKPTTRRSSIIARKRRSKRISSPLRVPADPEIIQESEKAQTPSSVFQKRKSSPVLQSPSKRCPPLSSLKFEESASTEFQNDNERTAQGLEIVELPSPDVTASMDCDEAQHWDTSVQTTYGSHRSHPNIELPADTDSSPEVAETIPEFQIDISTDNPEKIIKHTVTCKELTLPAITFRALIAYFSTEICASVLDGCQWVFVKLRHILPELCKNYKIFNRAPVNPV